ncbi:undecaprenyl diphosphate synthase family protein, partial [Francisella tularensis]|uniref:undecaprenyl diphosphate synthase family protein n=1 Tax=Francisella tularensis TaxID=263 RepID=UPI003C6D6144
MPIIFCPIISVYSFDANIEYCVDYNIEMLTLFGFVRDNWLRPCLEVSDLIVLFYITLKDITPKLHVINIV